MASFSEHDLDQMRQNAATAIRSNLAAVEALQNDLSTHSDVSQALLTTLQSGKSLPDKLVSINSHDIRPALTATIRTFERTRHRARLRLMEVALAEGASDHDVRELWNISQEMVRRAKREIAELDHPELPDESHSVG